MRRNPLPTTGAVVTALALPLILSGWLGPLTPLSIALTGRSGASRLKAELLTSGMSKGLEEIAGFVLDWYEANDLSKRWAARDRQAIKEVDKLLASMGLTIDAVVARALSVNIDSVERIDRMIMNAEARRNAALREMERHRATLALALRQASDDVVEADFEDVADQPAAKGCCMTSAHKLRANRANSLRSTGPKTAKGRAIAARNARRHGLRIPVLSDPAMSAEVDTMAQRIASDASPELVELARHVAEAEIDVIRVRRARSDLISRALESGDRKPVRARDLRRNVELPGRALKILNSGQSLPPELSQSLIRMKEEQAEAESVKHLPRFGPEFAIIDRYERRALSRRKFAIRAFDTARTAGIRGKVRYTKISPTRSGGTPPIR